MKIEQISVCYDNDIIVHPLSLNINPMEILVLMGPSGSGKTTLLRAIARLVPLATGSIQWDGQIGLAFQEARLFPHMNVIDNLAFGLRARGMSKKERYEKVKLFLKDLQLEGLESRYPHQLSGGQKQRVSLGRALILHPDLLLLDEPFSSLDTGLRHDLTEWLYKLQRQNGFSILWVTHYLDEAFAVADRIGVMVDGHLLQVGEIEEVWRKPHCEKVATFLSLPNRFSIEDWKEVFPNLKARGFENRGWIPQDAIFLRDNKNSPHFEEIGMIKGLVTRVKNEKNGKTLLVNTKIGEFSVSAPSFNRAPHEEEVELVIPYEKILWYISEK